VALNHCLHHQATIPSVNQMSFSVGNWDKTLIPADGQRGGIVVQAYSPLGGGGVVSDPDCIAIGKVHNKSAAQVVSNPNPDPTLYS
jgi:diketogulonate reductase-like aldo/keto reductase